MPLEPKLRAWDRLVAFIQHDLWHFNFSELNRFYRLLVHSLQVLLLTLEGFIKDNLFLRASALTTATLLAIVPMLAFMFALLKGLGAQGWLEPIFLRGLGASSQETALRILDFVGRINARSLGAVGLVLLLLTVINVLSNIEAAFNHIWGLSIQRSWVRKVSDYTALILLMPLVLFAVLSFTATLKSAAFIAWMQSQPGIGALVIAGVRLLPFVTLWVVFTFLFMVIPNTRVRLKPALLAGILTGTLWQLAQWAYVTFQVGAANYNAIYGTLAQLPIMLIWIYISWVIVLFGAEFSFALQNGLHYRLERESDDVSFFSTQELALSFLRRIDQRFSAGANLWSEEELAHEQQVPIRLARRVLNGLVRAGWLAVSGDRETRRYGPARDLASLTVSEVLDRLENIGQDFLHDSKGDPLHVPEHQWLLRARAARKKALRGQIVGMMRK